MTGLLLAALLAGAPSAGKPASIAFADTTGIAEWKTLGDRTVFVQGTRGRWYRAELIQACRELPYAQSLGFATGPGGRFDASSAVIAGGKRCPLRSLTEIEGRPPPEARRGR